MFRGLKPPSSLKRFSFKSMIHPELLGNLLEVSFWCLEASWGWVRMTDPRKLGRVNTKARFFFWSGSISSRILIRTEFSHKSPHNSLTENLGRSYCFFAANARNLFWMRWPSSLQTLTLGVFFNQSLEQVKLPNLQSLTFGYSFNQSLKPVTLPSTLQHLKLGGGFTQSLVGVQFPGGLQSLTLGGRNFRPSLFQDALPRTLKSLTFGRLFNQNLASVTLPDLDSLTFGDNFNLSLGTVNLPQSLLHLTLGEKFDFSIVEIRWPPNLLSLTFGSNLNQSLAHVHLPASLETLVFGESFNQCVGDLPSNLRSLSFRSSDLVPLAAGFSDILLYPWHWEGWAHHSQKI